MLEECPMLKQMMESGGMMQDEGMMKKGEVNVVKPTIR